MNATILAAEERDNTNIMSDSLLQETYTLLKPFKIQLIIAVMLGVIGGLGITTLLATINQAVNADSNPDGYLMLYFASLCILILISSAASNLIINYIGQHIVLQLRQRLAKQVLLAPIDQLERFRSHRLIPVLVHDVTTIRHFSLSIAPLIVSLAVTIGCLSYLAFLSWQILLLTLLMVVIGGAAQYLAFHYGKKYLDTARDGEDKLQKHFQTLSTGAKELRIQRSRRHQMFSEKIQGTTERICKANIHSANILISAGTFGSMLFFVVIGIVITYQTLWPSIDKITLSGFVLIMLYMKGPLEQIISTMPVAIQAHVAFQRIAMLSRQLLSREPHLLAPDKYKEPPVDSTNTQPFPMRFESLKLREIKYAFSSAEDRPAFTLGPINLDIHPNETIFIVGDNGCGKTTLIKLLLGLYEPQDGHILLNGSQVTKDLLDDYRQLFTTIFSDYHLFDELIQDQDHLPEQARNYLKRMDILHKVDIRNGVFTTTDLSTGQRKRLALVNAWLENRTILVFDEWAADQDPTFRQIFYTELLPDLKHLGKTIIVISHDDRYFNVADRVIKLENGKITENIMA